MNMYQECVERFNELRSSGLDILDPVNFAYLNGLQKRLLKTENVANHTLADKGWDALASAHAQLENTREEAKNSLVWIEENASNLHKKAIGLFSSYQLLALIALKEQEQERQLYKGDDGYKDDDCSALASLADLLEQLNQGKTGAQASEQGSSLEERLMEQEFATLDTKEFRQERSFEGTQGKLERPELHSLKLFKQSIKHSDVDKLIARALGECPPNPGPHNPQMLAVKALTELKALSPSYTRKFAAYLENMLWLEKGAERLNKATIK